MSRIESVQIQNFRGIRSLNLRLDEMNLLLLGDNGTGKSSVVDALEFFFTGKVEKFSGRADLKDRDCIQNANGGTPTVELRFAGESDSVVASFPVHNPTIPKSLESLFSSASSRPFILHRYQLLRFIESKPADRYKVVSDLIGLDQLEQIERSWKKSRDESEKSLEVAQGLCRQVLITLTDLLKSPSDLSSSTIQIQVESDLIIAIQQRMANYKLPKIQCRADIQSVRKAVIEKSRSPEDIGRAEQLRVLQRKYNQVQSDFEQAGQIFMKLDEAREDFIEKMESIDDSIFEMLLQEGRRLLAENDLGECPLCEQELTDRIQLLERLDSRLSRLVALTQSRSVLQRLRRNAIELARTIQRDLRFIEKDLMDLKLDAQLLFLRSALESVDIWLKSHNFDEDNQLTIDGLLQTAGIQEFNMNLLRINDELAREIQRLTPNASEQELFEIAVFLGRLDQSWATWQNSKVKEDIASSAFTQLDMIYKELVEARKTGLENILTELQAEFIRLFEKLHPNEGFQAVSLIIAKDKRSSIDMESVIQGHHTMHPLGNFSEGHLDSLGLCLFLAFLRRFNAEFKLIVLDDVLTSIDLDHRIRVARLLAEEFSDYQIILTTHDEMWANELKVIMGSKGLKFRFLRLQPWDLSHGSDIDEQVTSDWQFFRKLVEEGRKQDAIAGTGRNLEKFLSIMRRNFGLAIPATPDDSYSLGALYDPFFAWVKNHPFVRVDRPNVTSEISVLKEELDGYWRLRNWSGAHYNGWGAAVSTTESTDFIQIVQELVTIFECPVCKELVVYEAKTKLIHCPVCKPTPIPPVNLVYRSNWRINAQRLLRTGTLKTDEFAVGAIKAAFELFLRDMRWIAKLAVPPVQGGKYCVEDLFKPFENWACERSKEYYLSPNFEGIKEFLDEQWRWQPIEILSPRAEMLFQAVDYLIRVFECQQCQTPMHYDKGFYCPSCTKRVDEEQPIQAAYWTVC